MSRSMVLLTWGHSNPRSAKTATGLLRFCPEECAAVFDPDHAGRTAGEVLQVGGKVPFISQLADAPGANTLVIGIAPPGGKIPNAWRPIILEAIAGGMNILSGLHDFLSEDAEFREAAELHDVSITDVRKNEFKQIARRPGFNKNCLRIHTVGHDCSVGKLLVSFAISHGLQQRGLDAHFIATGQTGIMVSGGGLPIDCIVADFVSGAAEQLVLDHQQHDILVVEGQGSLAHPAYSSVTLGLLHGCQPHALVLVFEAERNCVVGMEHIRLPSLEQQIVLFETMARIYQPCETIAIAMNGSRLSHSEAGIVAERLASELKLPVVDIVRDGPDQLLNTVEAYYMSDNWRQT